MSGTLGAAGCGSRSVHWPPSCFTTPCSTQVLQHVHHEQGVPLSLVIQPRRQLSRHLPAQPRRYIRLDLVGEEQLQRQFVADPAPPQLLEHPAQRVRPHHHVHRPIRPQEQEPGRVPPLRQIGEHVHRGHITPVQVFEHQHQGEGHRQRVQGLGQLAEHPCGRRALELPLEALALAVAEQRRQVHQPRRRVALEHAPGAPRGAETALAAPRLPTAADTVPRRRRCRHIVPARPPPPASWAGWPQRGRPPWSCRSRPPR